MARAQANRLTFSLCREELQCGDANLARMKASCSRPKRSAAAFLQQQSSPYRSHATSGRARCSQFWHVLEDADFLLESALEFAPDNIQIRLDYIQILRKRQKFADALAHRRKILFEQRSRTIRFSKSHYAIECMQTGDYDNRTSDYSTNILETGTPR